jgi:hypothetical protein
LIDDSEADAGAGNGSSEVDRVRRISARDEEAGARVVPLKIDDLADVSHYAGKHHSFS